MKRGPLPPRRTPLRTYTPLAPGGELSRSTPLARTPMPRPEPLVAKPAARVRRPPRPARTVEETRARRLVADRSGGVCEVRVVCAGAPASNWHHRRNRGQGGDWTASNGLHCCGSGSTGCHGWIGSNLAEARARGWAVSAFADPATIPALVAGRGLVLLTTDGGTIDYGKEDVA